LPILNVYNSAFPNNSNMVGISYQPELVTVERLLERVRSCEWALELPSFQRTYVWDNEDIIELIESVVRGLPIGIFMLWEVKDNPNPFALRILPSFMIGGQTNRRLLIVDGQQRLVSLLLLASDWILKIGPYEIRRGPISLNTQKLTLELGSKGAPLSRAIAAKLGWTDELERLKHEYKPFERLIDVVEKLLKYELSLFILRTEEEGPDALEEMAELFIRANRAGQRISNVELMLSYAAGVLDPELSKIMREWYDKLQKICPSLEIQPIIRYGFGVGLGLKQREIDQVERFKAAVDKLKGQKNIFGKSIITSSLQESLPYLESAIKIINEIIGCSATDFIPSQLSLVPIAAFLRTKAIRSSSELKKNEKEEILCWLILTNFHGYYSTSTSTKLQEDIELISETTWDSFPFNELLRNIEQKKKGATKIERRDLEKGIEEDITKRPGRPYMFLLYTLLCLNDATDWVGARISVLPSNRLHKHHIFPREYLFPKGHSSKLNEDAIKIASGLGNITLINPELDSEIGSTKPIDYLGRKVPIDELKRHFIPEDAELWNKDMFSEFCEKRVELIYNFLRSSPLSKIT